ncbi:MAG TPA: M20 family metallo-hydrolase [Atribacterota bacterium]|nr:M20 family metallo-hydrolase [Atribacterota bacterium]
MINMNRFKVNLMELAKISDAGEGVTRLGFTPTFFKGRDFIQKLMHEVGLKTKIDSVGNLIGRWKGKQPDKQIIAIGSHIDTVPNGGKYYGAIGVLGAIEVLWSLKEMNYQSVHPIEVISFINEEGSAPANIGGDFGSCAMMGLINNIDKNLEREFFRVKLTRKDLVNSYREPGQFKCYLEMHIEQGSILEQNNLSIGIVTSIVGSWRFLANIKGISSHAGTTPMNQRDDALLKSLPVIQYVNEIAKEINKGMVGTVGGVTVKPGAFNVVPGEVILKLEFRSINIACLEKAVKMLQDKMRLINGSNLQIVSKSDPVMLDDNLQSVISQICENSKIKHIRMPSFAGHDARETAKKMPTALIFVPSKDGISHSPLEFTPDDAIEKGIFVLLETVKRADIE